MVLESMTELSPTIAKRARKINTLFLQALAEHSQKGVAARMGVHETTVSNLKGEKLQSMANFIAACGLKVVPESMHCYDESYITALKTLAGVGIKAPALMDGSDE